MSQSRLERLQEKADVKPKADKPVAPASLKMQNQELMEAERKADRYAFLALKDNIWYYRDRLNIPRGPCPLRSLRVCYVNGIIDENTLVWGQGLEEWVPMRNVRTLPALVRTVETMVAKSFKGFLANVFPKPSSSTIVVGKSPKNEPYVHNDVPVIEGIPAYMTAANMLNKGLFKREEGANEITALACASLAFELPNQQ